MRKRTKIAAGILSLSILGISGVYGYFSDTLQVVNHISVGDIKISVEEFKKKGTKEVLYNNKGDVLPGAVVSKIPRITNRALPCWVRARILYTNDRKELEGLDDTKLSGFSSKWIKRGEYYYYTSILKRKETVDLFQSVHIPASWKKEHELQKLGLTIQAEAIQAANFTPDFSAMSPWGNQLIRQCIHEEDGAMTCKKPQTKLSVEFNGKAHKLLSVPGDFFTNLGTAMPGDVLTDTITVSNTTDSAAEAMAITAISAALGLGRLIALPFAGPLSDKLGRRISTAIGSASYAIYLVGLALAFNAGTNGGYTIAYVCAIVGGIANSFLDTGIYPAVSEIIYKAPGVATMGIKFFIAIAQMMLPFVLGATVATTAAGLTSYNRLFFGCGIIYFVLFVLVFLFPLPDTDQKAAGKKEGLIDSLKHTHFSLESVAMILIGFTCTGTFQLWLNCAQNFAKENVGWADPSIMQTYYSAGTLIALVVTALLTRKIKDVRFIVIYPVICLATLIVVLMGQSQTLMIAGAFIIGWAGAGGLLQIATSVCNMLFPKIKGTVTALVMIASSLCNYTILTAASKMQPSQVMTMNIVLTAVGVVLGLYVNIRYKKMVALAEAEN